MRQNYTIKDYAKMSAEKEISKYSEAQIAQLAKKEKRIGYISTAVLFAVDIGMIAMFVWSLLEKLSFFTVSSAIVFSVSLVFNIFYYLKNKNNTNYVWAVKYLERKYINNPNAFPEFFIYENCVNRSSSSVNSEVVDNSCQKYSSLMDTPREYNWCEEKTLMESIKESWESLNFIISSILIFGKNLGMSKDSLVQILKRSYNFGKSRTVDDLFLEIEIEKNKEEINLNDYFDEEIVEELLNCNFDEMFLELHELQKTDKERLKNSMLSVFDDENNEYYWDFYKHQFVLAFLKLQLYGRIISEILENKELCKLLNNAYKKFNDIEECAHKTYDFIFDYMSLSNEKLTRENYFSLLKIFYLIQNNCASISESLFNEIDFDTTSVNEIVNEFIDKKLYVSFDIKIVINAILTKKMQQPFTLQEFIEEIFKIEEYKQKVKTVKLKDELLSDDGFENKISIADIDLMSGAEFEEFLCNYFKDIGYKCEQTKATGDQGVDLIAIKDNAIIAIQAKCYSSVVGNHAIMEVFAGAKYYNANKCMVITNSTFTKSAIELAKTNDVILWDRQILIEKLSQM